ncbi:MAG: transporter substrate-binding domain-containing protein, partial [Candidatus Marinimicrobia bacterium]|nr:transporter substrate-binding domain-containing protein [Candidatus Neomarinimicrobiota bacterium]
MSFIDLLRRGFRKIRIPAFALMMLIPFSVQAGTSISVGIYQNQPKIFLNEQGMPSGIFVDLLNEIAKQENWTLRYVPGTWDQCLDHLKTGTIDLLPDMALS